VKRPQIIVLLSGILLTALIYSFGSTKFPQKKVENEMKEAVSIENMLAEAQKKFDSHQKEHFGHLQEDLAKEADTTKKSAIYDQMIRFWGEEVQRYDIACWYIAERAKLENSEKSLTFAAQFILDESIREDGNPMTQGWKARLSRSLFEEALKKSPGKDSLKIGLGATYLFGAGGNNPMEGITFIRTALQNDSTNAYAHKMLGYGNIRNGQIKQAIERFEKAFRYNPAEADVLPVIALLYKQTGDKENAEKWRERVKKEFAGNPAMLARFEEQFQSLK
jgi:tetratricopeptide (TPR) repeat protein